MRHLNLRHKITLYSTVFILIALMALSFSPTIAHADVADEITALEKEYQSIVQQILLLMGRLQELHLRLYELRQSREEQSMNPPSNDSTESVSSDLTIYASSEAGPVKPTPLSERFSIGMYVQTIDLTKVRALPGKKEMSLGRQPVGASGTIVAGPVQETEEDVWWKVNYVNGPDGWSNGETLEYVN